MGQSLGTLVCCRGPQAADSGEAAHRQRDQPAAKALAGPPAAPVAEAAALAAGSSSPRSAATGPATRRTSLSGYYSATGASSDGEDEWHDALSDIDSGESRPMALPSRAQGAAALASGVLCCSHASSNHLKPPARATSCCPNCPKCC